MVPDPVAAVGSCEAAGHLGSQCALNAWGDISLWSFSGSSAATMGADGLGLAWGIAAPELHASRKLHMGALRTHENCASGLAHVLDPFGTSRVL
jgi:hypothetical protein